jgi:hypothetical protein
MNAFPHLVPHNPDFAYSATGMTLRDYFAGQALVGYLSDGSTPSEYCTAKQAYAYADAMLEVRDA